VLETPVALIIFNRPETTARVLAEIARARPRRLLVVADGPRADRAGEADRCAAARAVIDRVDWDCEVLRNYSDVNLGCGRRPATGISWVFEQVEEAIVLEDDCVPHPTFFRYCEELLRAYRDDERVMHVGGSGFQRGAAGPYSYFFSRHYPSWGWASWRRAWRHFDMSLRLWPGLRPGPWLADVLGDDRLVEHWRTMFDRTHAAGGDVSWWDFQWTFACWSQSGLSILPYVTLVSNIGFGPDATHTRRPSDPIANLPATEMAFPLRHPPYVLRDRDADGIFADQVIVPYLRRRPGLYRRLRQRCAEAMPLPVRRSLSAARSRLLPG
jgi:hypothetical protein